MRTFLLITLLFLALDHGLARAAFVDNGDGTVTDTVTCLQWQKASMDTKNGVGADTYNWQEALAASQNLSLAGHSDWRLPDRNELLSLVDYSRHSPAIDPVFGATTPSSDYWSSTTYAGDTDNADNAWHVYFGIGLDYYDFKSSGYYVRAVRGGQCGQGECINPNISKPTISESGDSNNPAYLFTVTLAQPLPDGQSLAINFDNRQGGWFAQAEDGGHVLASCEGTTCTVERPLDYPGIRYFRAGIFNSSGQLQGCYSSPNTCTLDSCKAAVIKKNEIGDPDQSNSGSLLLRGVDVATGNFHHSVSDLSVSSQGPDFSIVRAYNSLGGASRSGQWSFNLDARAQLESFNIMRIEPREDGRAQHFYKDVDGKWYPLNPGNFDELVRETNGSVTLYTKGNLLYKFANPEGTEAGRLESIQDRDGKALVFSHTNNRITGATDGGGHLYTIIRDSAGRITRVSDFSGRSVSYTWDAGSSMILTATNPLGKSTSYGYSGTRLTTITDPRSNLQATIGYYTALANDDFGRVKSVTDGLNNAWGYQYGIDNVYSNNLPSTGISRPAVNGINNNIIFHVDDDRTHVVDRIDSMDAGNYRSKNTFKTFTSNKRIAETALVEHRVRPSGASKDIQYKDDGKGNPTKITEPITDTQSRETNLDWGTVANQTNLTPLTSLKKPGVTNPTQYRTFTASGKATEIEDPLNQKSYRQFEDGLLTQSTDARGNNTTYAYENGNPTDVVDALGNTTVTHYDELGRVTSSTNARGFTTSYTYDANGNVLTTTNPAGGVTTNTYDDNDNLVSTKDPRNTTTTFVYDALNRKIEEHYTVSGQAKVRKFAYDAMGRLYRQTNEKGKVSESRFDARGNTLMEIDPLSESITYTYDANGNVKTVTDAEGRVVTYTYDALDRKTRITDALGNYEEFTYNAQGLLASKRDGRGQTTEYEYDALGRMTKVTDPDGGITQATYDPNGNLLTTVDRKGQTTSYAYDALNRMVGLTDPLNRQWQFTYDANGNLLSRTMPSGQTITFTYDNLDRVSSVSYPAGPNVTYTYDANGNRLSMTDAVGTTNYVYDEQNRLTKVTNAYRQAVSYGYDASGQLASLVYPGSKTVNYTYDAADRLLTVADWLGQTTSYSRDGSGLITAVQYGNGAKVQNSYDAVGRLISLVNRNASNTVISSHTLTLDGYGNPTSAMMDLPLLPDNVGKTAEMLYDASNRLTSVGGATITHDADGRVTDDQSGIDLIQYAYNAQDLITKVSKAGVITDTYTYDGDGRRIARVSGGQTTRYLLDPTGSDLYRVLAETNDSNAVQRYYIYGEGLLEQISGTSHHYYHYDPSGNTLALTDGSGAVSDKYAYESFGNTTAQGSTVNPFRFVGKYGVMDDGNGLQHMRARYYRPDLRRFVSLDALSGQVSDPMTLNRYQYVGGNPMVGMDPSGNSPVCVGHYYGADYNVNQWISVMQDDNETFDDVLDRIAYYDAGIADQVVDLKGNKYIYTVNGWVDIPRGYSSSFFEKNGKKYLSAQTLQREWAEMEVAIVSDIGEHERIIVESRILSAMGLYDNLFKYLGKGYANNYYKRAIKTYKKGLKNSGINMSKEQEEWLEQQYELFIQRFRGGMFDPDATSTYDIEAGVRG